MTNYAGNYSPVRRHTSYKRNYSLCAIPGRCITYTPQRVITDNAPVLSTVNRLPSRCRGVALPSPDRRQCSHFPPLNSCVFSRLRPYSLIVRPPLTASRVIPFRLPFRFRFRLRFRCTPGRHYPFTYARLFLSSFRKRRGTLCAVWRPFLSRVLPVSAFVSRFRELSVIVRACVSFVACAIRYCFRFSVRFPFPLRVLSIPI